MFISRWWKSRISASKAVRTRDRARRLRFARLFQPKVEALEPRRLLATFIVSTTSDGGAGSLRAAITSANASPGSVIDFNIGASGVVQTITPASALPTITAAVTIDGTTEPGYTNTPLINLNGAGLNATGLQLTMDLATSSASPGATFTFSMFDALGNPVNAIGGGNFSAIEIDVDQGGNPESPLMGSGISGGPARTIAHTRPGVRGPSRRRGYMHRGVPPPRLAHSAWREAVSGPSLSRCAPADDGGPTTRPCGPAGRRPRGQKAAPLASSTTPRQRSTASPKSKRSRSGVSGALEP